MIEVNQDSLPRHDRIIFDFFSRSLSTLGVGVAITADGSPLEFLIVEVFLVSILGRL
jgi:hypothetical protein